MTQGWQRLVACGMVVGVSGCARVQTHIVEMPRVDQEVAGNQGYLQGTGAVASARAPRRATRQVVMADVELMTGQEIKQGMTKTMRASRAPIKGELGPNGRGWRMPAEPAAAPELEAAPLTASAPVVEPELPPMSEAPMDMAQPPAAEPAPPAAAATYVVQRDDTLEKIAKKMYGDFRKWPRIYKANRDVIKNPNLLRAGLRLTIPPLPRDDSETR
ncbi:MAG: LysM peptidoglycan-binding domain-containing protein [Candidatus Omnitrophica bacterium]|nr:LysM peptidoglycan-binding domain-containing protein [Candidatus Omnitrophota bacterium]